MLFLNSARRGDKVVHDPEPPSPAISDEFALAIEDRIRAIFNRQTPPIPAEVARADAIAAATWWTASKLLPRQGAPKV